MRSDSWQWAWDGKAENQAPDISPKTVWPEDQLRYNGHYPHGEDTIISYSVQGREVLESPKLEKIEEVAVIHHRLTIKPGSNQLELIVPDGETGNQWKLATAGFQRSGCRPMRRVRNSVPVKTVNLFCKYANKKAIHLNVVLSHDESDSIKNKQPSNQITNLADKTKVVQEDGKALTRSRAVWQPPLFRAM